MTPRVEVLVAGASVASGAFVSQLRDDGFTGLILLVDQDPDAPYDRPPLSKDFLGSGAAKPEAPWWTGGCDLLRGRAVHLDVRARAVTVAVAGGDTERIVADHVVIATGAAPVRLPGLPEGVNHLRTAADARELREKLEGDCHVVVLGAGTIGTEISSTVVDAGGRVTMVDLADRPLDRFFAGHLGDDAASWIRDGGVDLLLETRVESVDRHDSGWTVITDAHGAIEADFVISAVGTRPAVSWLKGSGLDLVDGIQCDEDGTVLAMTGESLSGIHAVGDVAAWRTGEGFRRRREDWTSAQRQGRHVARLIMGLVPLQALDESDYFWTHQFGRRIQVLGTPLRDARLVTRSENPDRRAAFHVLEHDGRPVAWISINSPRDFALAMRESSRSVRATPSAT
jgi:3-phenylpropionate/trans-cinnamate dioxygenase ferredoxin reductase subunit